MQSVTSNAVAESIGDWETLAETSKLLIKGKISKDGAYLSLWMQQFEGTYGQELCTLPQKYIDLMQKSVNRFIYFQTINNGTVLGFCNINKSDKKIMYYPVYANSLSFGNCLIKLE